MYFTIENLATYCYSLILDPSLLSKSSSPSVKVARRELRQAPKLPIPFEEVIYAVMAAVITIRKHNAVSVGVAIHYVSKISMFNMTGTKEESKSA